jgi:16S rRNA G966 N2-methylase RsmD
MSNNLFSDFDFSSLDSPNFKEDSVREDLIMPILKELGYSSQSENKIIRSKKVRHPFVTVGAKELPLTNFPDYLLEVGGKYAWVIDAKAPNEDIKTGKNVEQAYFYAIHPEIRVPIYALCNGREFIAFDVHGETLIYFSLSEIEKHWHKLQDLLSPPAFDRTQKKIESNKNGVDFDYLSRKPLEEIRNVRKRAARRHFGVHGYFTKQSWDIVHAYIKNFTKPNDVVLDPFGGSGVTVVEALMTNRRGIHIDINPLSILMVKGLVAPVRIDILQDEFDKLKEKYLATFPKTDEEIEKALETYKFTSTLKLPKSADVSSVEKLFSDKQKAHLAYLKHLIMNVKNKNVRDSFLLAFSSTITRTNLTYHWSSQGETGDASAFRYYRYRIAPDPASYEVIDSFSIKVRNLTAAKREMQAVINETSVENAQIYKGTATNLEKIENESVDYIYTDPPYGKKIPYLDLSIMWNAWLDLEVSEKDYQLEAIEGGEHNKTKNDYSNLLAESIREMYRVLKFDRWMSFVFAHKDPEYWHLIVDTAEKSGFEYVSAVKQNNGQTSFKKRQNPFTILSGQLIINFKKVRNPKSIMKANLGADITDLIIQSIEGVIAKNTGATLEEINDELIIKGLELGFLDILSRQYQDITPFLLANFDYDKETEKYLLKKNTKFRSQIPIELRIRFYLESMLRRFAREGKATHFSDIILEIMPLLKNGITPDNQTILSVLENIADKVGEDSWRLKESGQRNLFNLI